MAEPITLAIETLNDGRDARYLCGDCGGYLILVANYDQLPHSPSDFFWSRQPPQRVFDRIVAHRCAPSVPVDPTP